MPEQQAFARDAQCVRHQQFGIQPGSSADIGKPCCRRCKGGAEAVSHAETARRVRPHCPDGRGARPDPRRSGPRSEEHTSELESLMRISYAVFCLKKKKQTNTEYA